MVAAKENDSLSLEKAPISCRSWFTHISNETRNNFKGHNSDGYDCQLLEDLWGYPCATQLWIGFVHQGSHWIGACILTMLISFLYFCWGASFNSEIDQQLLQIFNSFKKIYPFHRQCLRINVLDTDYIHWLCSRDLSISSCEWLSAC